MIVDRNNKLIRRAFVLAVPGILMPAVAVSDDIALVRQQNTVYFSDSQRERDPAVTAFPKYPYVARRDRMEGETTVCFTVNAKGQVIRPSIRNSSHKIFERPAMKAIRESRFDPLNPGETKSNLKTCRIFRFRLDPIVASTVENGDP
jgi:protein TonB